MNENKKKAKISKIIELDIFVHIIYFITLVNRVYDF